MPQKVIDPSLLENGEIYFNAARLDRSMVLKTSDYIVVAKPRFERIAEGGGTSQDRPSGGGNDDSFC